MPAEPVGHQAEHPAFGFRDKTGQARGVEDFAVHHHDVAAPMLNPEGGHPGGIFAGQFSDGIGRFVFFVLARKERS